MESDISNTNNSTSESKSNFLSTVAKFIVNFLKGIVITTINLARSFLAFFLALGASAKFTFVVILIVFTAFAYFFGYSSGKNAGKDNVKDNVYESTGYKVEELDILMDRFADLQEALDRVNRTENNEEK